MDPAFWDALPDVLSVKDLAGIIRKGDITVWRWLNNGVIPGHKVATSWVCYKSEVRDWITDPKREYSEVPMPTELLAKFPEVLTVAELAEILGKTPQTAYQWLKTGALPGRQLEGNWSVFKSEITDLLRETSNVVTVTTK